MKNKVIFLSSGSGGNLKVLYKAINVLNLNIEVIGVIADRECDAIRFSKDYKIPHKICNFKTDIDEVKAFIYSKKANTVVTNIHKILPDDLINLPQVNFINLHYSMLPLYKGMIGMQPLEAALKDNQEYVGGSCHKVTSELDGGTVLGQSKIEIDYKEINKDLLITLIFRSTAILLVNELAPEEGGFGSTINWFSKKVKFTPDLGFNSNLLDENFWNSISKI